MKRNMITLVPFKRSYTAFYTVAIVVLLTSLFACQDSGVTSSADEDTFRPAIKVGEITEGDTLRVEEGENGNVLEVGFMDDFSLGSYSVSISSPETELVNLSADTSGTQVFELVDISGLNPEVAHDVSISLEDKAGNSSSLNFVLIVTENAAPEPLYNEMYLVGDATPGGWDLASQTPMNVDEVNPNIFTWSGQLTTGEFKIKAYGETEFCGGEWVHPLSQGQPLSETGFDIITTICGEDYSDYKWEIVTEGTYTISLNLEEETITIVLEDETEQPAPPYEELYLVGDATPGGWSLDQQTPMVKDENNPFIFSWTGTLTAGNFKIKTYPENDFCGGEWLHPLAPDPAFSDSGYEALQGCGEHDDNQWVVDEAETGEFTITVDLEAETINIDAP